MDVYIPSRPIRAKPWIGFPGTDGGTGRWTKFDSVRRFLRRPMAFVPKISLYCFVVVYKKFVVVYKLVLEILLWSKIDSTKFFITCVE